MMMVVAASYNNGAPLFFLLTTTTLLVNLMRCGDAFASISLPNHRISKPKRTRSNDSNNIGGFHTPATRLRSGSSSSSSNNDNIDSRNDNSSSDNEDGKSSEIFLYDDFNGPIGDVVLPASSPSLSSPLSLQLNCSDADEDEELLPDFDDREESLGVTFVHKNRQELISIPLPTAITTNTAINDLTGATYREFTLGRDILLSDYAGSLGFDQVTDWQYYTTDVITGETTNRSPPNPFDSNTPSRTRSKSGRVVRIFRGEFTGRLGGLLRSRGLDTRVLLKEFECSNLDDDDKTILNLATDEKKSLSKLQSSWLTGYCINSSSNSNNQLLKRLENGEWIEEARKRYVDGLTDTPTSKDDNHLATLLECLSTKKAPFTSMLGELNLNDYYDDEDIDPNEWYRTLGVKPPKPGSVWIVYDYHGLSTAASYAVPLSIQKSKLPPKRGVFGRIVEAEPLPPFNERARYMIRGVLRGMLQSIATAHAAGIVHRSIGKNSFLLSSVGQDKREATNPYAVVVERLRVVLGDWGFSRDIKDAVVEKEFCGRCRMFGIPSLDSYEYQRFPSSSDTGRRMEEAAAQFAKAEDLHACGFVFLSMLFTTLADPATLSAPMPATDDDTLQRLFSDIFEKNIDELRDYYLNEDVWSSVVAVLDMEERAGWDLLGKMLLAREQVSEWHKKNDEKDDDIELTSAENLLCHPFFQMKII